MALTKLQLLGVRLPSWTKYLRAQARLNCLLRSRQKVEFLINLKTAKTLGISIPSELLSTADEVFE